MKKRIVFASALFLGQMSFGMGVRCYQDMLGSGLRAAADHCRVAEDRAGFRTFGPVTWTRMSSDNLGSGALRAWCATHGDFTVAVGARQLGTSSDCRVTETTISR